MDKQNIRDRMQNVFGTYNDFCHTLSSTGSSLTRHGVVQTPTTPVTRAPSFAPRQISPTGPSVRECVQVMSELVSSPPLMPPQLSTPLLLHRDFAHSSSTRSSPDETEAKKKKRKHKNPDSDSELEREKRKRQKDAHIELSKPGTSRSKDDDAMKELFGDDTSKPNGSEKCVSPDSGVHSTENDGMEENDITAMVNAMSTLLPMLSPLTERPSEKHIAKDREKEKKDKEEKRRKEEQERKEEAERKLREEKRRLEEERRLQEEKKREEERRLQEEKRAAEERKREEERKAAEEKRKEEERRFLEEKRLADEKRKEEEREKEERRKEEERKREEEKRIADEKKKEEERRLAEERKEEEKQKRILEERRKKETEEAEKEKRRLEELNSSISQPLTESSNRLSGVLPLHLLSTDKMSKLLDLGRKSGKLETKAERPKSPLVTAEKNVKKRRDREAVDGENVKKRSDLKAEPESTSSPRPGSSLAGREFRCACNEVLPSRAVRPNIPAEKQEEFFQNHAKSLKRKADQTPDHVRKILLYIDSIVYFAMGARFMPPADKQGTRKASIFRDTADLAKQTTSRFTHCESLSPLQQHFLSRIRFLSIRIQAILAFNLYQSRSHNVLKTFHVLEQLQDDNVIINKGDDSSNDGRVSSPGGSSVHSSSNQGCSSNATATVPLETYSLQKSQLKMLHNLMWAHKLWSDASHMIHKSPIDTQFVNSLESLCGVLCVTTPVEKMVTFFLTGVTWLREEYELELKRPPPTPVKNKNQSA